MKPSQMTLSGLERSKWRSLGFQSLISRKGTKLGPMLLLSINRKPYTGSPMTSSLLILSDLERSKSWSPRCSVFACYAYISQQFITTWIWTQKGVCWRGVFSTVPAVFLVDIQFYSEAEVVLVIRTQIWVRFALRPAIVEIQGCYKSENLKCTE